MKTGANAILRLLAVGVPVLTGIFGDKLILLFPGIDHDDQRTIWVAVAIVTVVMAFFVLLAEVNWPSINYPAGALTFSLITFILLLGSVWDVITTVVGLFSMFNKLGEVELSVISLFGILVLVMYLTIAMFPFFVSGKFFGSSGFRVGDF